MTVERLYGRIDVAPSSIVGEHCVLGCPKEKRLRAFQTDPAAAAPGAPVRIGERCLLFNHVVVYEGVTIGDDCVVEDRVRIGYDSTIAARSRLVYGAYICDRVTIGADARVAGFVCDATIIGDRSSVMGELVHEYAHPHHGWWEVDEDPPVIEADTVVGYGARVVGGVKVGPDSYVASGAVVTKDVPPRHVATGVNMFTPAARWRGRRLQSLIQEWTTPTR